MLEEFKESQFIAYKTVINAISNNKVSHSYLIDANGYKSSFDFTLAMAKALLCSSEKHGCLDCDVCKNIDSGNFIELKIVEPDGQWIKKSQIDEIQNFCEKKAIIGDKKIYIINGVECLNQSSANSLLKFLEEPEEGIIALLITNNVNQVINTIVSRCQLLSLVNRRGYGSKEKIWQDFQNRYDILNEDVDIKINGSINFINEIEKNGIGTLVKTKKIWHDIFSNKEDLLVGLELMILFYKDVLNLMIGQDVIYFYDYISKLKEVSNNNTVESIITKIGVIDRQKSKIKYNINSNLLIDKLIIDLKGVK